MFARRTNWESISDLIHCCCGPWETLRLQKVIGRCPVIEKYRKPGNPVPQVWYFIGIVKYKHDNTLKCDRQPMSTHTFSM